MTIMRSGIKVQFKVWQQYLALQQLESGKHYPSKLVEMQS